MNRFRTLQISAIIAMLSAATTVVAADRSELGVRLTIIDPIDLPVLNFIPRAPAGKVNARYAAQPVACNHRYNLCIDPQGRPVGSIDEVRLRLPVVDLADVREELVVCDRVCYDSTGRIVGALPRIR